MIPSIDYLTIVLAGAIMLAGAANTLDGGRFNKTGFALAVAGLFLFIVGTARAFMSAFGL